MSKLTFQLKQYAKTYLNHTYLPKVYKQACRQPIVPGKIIFADSHTNGITTSMKPVWERLIELGYQPLDLCVDFGGLSFGELKEYLVHFMQEYATAEYVFISSYFLPVSSCEKRKETTVVQLWHSGGLLKKMGYDTPDDIASSYKGNPTANYDLVTVSAEVCVPVWEQALRLPKGITKATGIARSDIYFDQAWNEANAKRFYERYPEAKGKKICVYAPSFEGNAAAPFNRSLESGILDVMQELSEEWYFAVRLHPHMAKDHPQIQCEFPPECLFSVADLLITDYSSVLYDYSLYQKPFVMYAVDIEEYEKTRGFYIEYGSLPAHIVTNAGDLKTLLSTEDWKAYQPQLEEFYRTFMGACDGQATDRILAMAGIDTDKRA